MSLTLKMTAAYFDSINYKYQVVDENVMRVGISGLSNKGRMDVFLIFDPNDRTVGLRSHDYCAFSESKKPAMYEICSKMNEEFRWVKFYVDERDCTVTLGDDAVVQVDSCGEELLELVSRMCNIADDAYPNFMKAIWA